MHKRELSSIIGETLNTLLDTQRSVGPNDVTLAILDDRKLDDAVEYADFYAYCAHRHVSAEVRKFLNDCKASAKEMPPALIDLQNIQLHYLVEREGGSVIVRFNKTTKAEKIAKAEELEAMGHGCFDHADALRMLAELGAEWNAVESAASPSMFAREGETNQLPPS